MITRERFAGQPRMRPRADRSIRSNPNRSYTQKCRHDSPRTIPCPSAMWRTGGAPMDPASRRTEHFPTSSMQPTGLPRGEVGAALPASSRSCVTRKGGATPAGTERASCSSPVAQPSAALATPADERKGGQAVVGRRRRRLVLGHACSHRDRRRRAAAFLKLSPGWRCAGNSASAAGGPQAWDTCT